MECNYIFPIEYKHIFLHIAHENFMTMPTNKLKFDDR